ncbi:MAG: hypothetical protein H6573_26025 [Lewinellaceae bacterium]|nr:hypothetical protein [Lewinellaceae bacterium]
MRNPVRRYLSEHKTLFFFTIFLVGIIFSVLARIQLDELGFGSFSYQTQDIYESILTNIAAGFFLASIMYYLTTRFNVDEQENQLKHLEFESSEIRKKIDDLGDNIEGVKTQLQALDISGQNTKIIYDEDKYHEQVNHLIENAKKKIIYLGDGFPCHNRQTKEFAQNRFNALRKAMRDGITIQYFHWHETHSLYWLDFLYDLKQENGKKNNLKIFISSNVEYDMSHHPISRVIIDPGEKNSFVCLRFTKDPANSDSLKYFEFGAGCILRDQKFSEVKTTFYQSPFAGENLGANSLKKMMESYRESCVKQVSGQLSKISQEELSLDYEDLVRIANKADNYELDLIRFLMLEKMIENKRYYFAIGLDMNLSYFKKKFSSAVKIDNAMVSSYKIGTNIRGRSGKLKNSGLLNMIPTGDTSDRVWGVLYALSVEDYNALVGVKDQEGFIKLQEVKLEEFESRETDKLFPGRNFATTFLAMNNRTENYPPTADYQKAIIQAMENNEIIMDFRNDVSELFRNTKR